MCPALTTFVINDKCKSCGLCVKACPVEAINAAASAVKEKSRPYVINQKLCTSCGSCLRACKFAAIDIKGRA
ncbi:MAG: 4Fe-4S binding protein [Treponema sp.]|nr:4Fe-4S binding protein [Treponema sp.]